MNLKFAATLCFGFVVLFVQACSSTTTSLPVLPAQTLYGSNASTPGAVVLFKLPLTASSVSTGALAGVGNIPNGMCVSASGLLVVTEPGSNQLQAWSSPGAGVSPSFAVALTPLIGAEDCAFDPSGNLYIAASSGSILVYPAFAQGSSAGTPITTGINTPVGVCTDGTGDVFVGNNHSVTEYSPLSSGNGLLVSINGTGGPAGIAIGPDHNLYVANFTTGGKLDVFVPPFMNTSTVDHQISPPGATDLKAIKFDRAGNLYVTGANGSSAHNGIYVYAPPYTGSPIELDTASTVGIAII